MREHRTHDHAPEAAPAARPPKHVFDIELFEALNEEYRIKPLVSSPPSHDHQAETKRSRTRIAQVHESIDLANKRVLEIGCGRGFEVWTVSHNFDSTAYGIDVKAYEEWQLLADDRTHFEKCDLSSENPYPPGSFDRAVSFVVWEHTSHPFRMLQETYRALRPGGFAYISANLYRGTMASHRYREVYFPWPQLLFSDEVFREFYARRGRHNVTASWVNKLTWAQYERYFELAGFEIRMAKLTGSAFDEAFYKRFERQLGKYPRFDLAHDFFTVVLEKPA